MRIKLVYLILILFIILIGFLLFKILTREKSNLILKEGENITIYKKYLDYCNSAFPNGTRGSLCLPEGFLDWRCEQGYYPVDDCKVIANMVKNKEISPDVCYQIKYPDAVAYCLSTDKCFDYAKDNAELKRICVYKKCREQTNQSCFNEYFYGESKEDCEDYNILSKIRCYAYHNKNLSLLGDLCENQVELNKENISTLTCDGFMAGFSGDFSKCFSGEKYQIECIKSFYQALEEAENLKLQNKTNIFNSFCETAFKNQLNNQSICRNVTSYSDFRRLFIGCIDTDGGKNYYEKGYVTDNEGLFGGEFCIAENPYYCQYSNSSEKSSDICLNPQNYLYETYCGENGELSSEIYKCPNGCAKDKCTK